MVGLPTRLICVLAAGLAFLGCETPPTSNWSLVEKGSYQTLYQPDGRIERLLYDHNGDGRAEMVVMYGPRGTPTVSQIDTNIDGVVDRWEHFDRDGNLVTVVRAERRAGVPDTWEFVDKAGEPTRREFDDDADARVDRTEYLSRGKVFFEEVDTDHSGKADRRVLRDSKGTIVKIEVDKNEDGYWEPVVPVLR